MLESIIGRSFQLLVMLAFIYWWHKCYKNGWTKISVFVTGVLMFFGMAIYEGYYLQTGNLPWFFGLEKTFANHTDGGPAFFLIICGILAGTLAFWLMPKFAKWWNEKGYMPGSITKISICGVGLVLLLLTTGNASAYLCHSYGYTWGMNFVSLGGNTVADAAEIGMSENDKMQTEFDEARSKTQRRAPVEEHRHTNSRTNGR